VPGFLVGQLRQRRGVHVGELDSGLKFDDAVFLARSRFDSAQFTLDAEVASRSFEELPPELARQLAALPTRVPHTDVPAPDAGSLPLGVGVDGTAVVWREDVQKSMQRRIPGPDVPLDQLRNRGWWSGPDLYVVVDDTELVSPGGSDPLEPLREFLPQAKDVGLHLVFVRRTEGAADALEHGVLSTLVGLQVPGVVGDGDFREGRCWVASGHRP
jgi:hypothetical protein